MRIRKVLRSLSMTAFIGACFGFALMPIESHASSAQTALEQPSKAQSLSIRQRILTNRIKGLEIEERYLKPLKQLYGSTRYTPVWLSNGSLTRQAKTLIKLVNRSHEKGLDPQTYGLQPFASAISIPAAQASLIDLQLSYAALRYVEHVSNGRVSPTRILKELDFEFEPANLPRLAKKLSRSDEPQGFIAGLEPQHDQYRRLKQRLARLDREKDKAEIATIAANLDRWRWMKTIDTTGTHVWINLPEQMAKVRTAEEVHFETTGIIGRLDAKTPLISSSIKNIILNPFWYLPPSVVKQEILEPHGDDPVAYLRRKRIKLLRSGGRIVEPEKVNWSRAKNPRKYVYRQSPGPENALGRVKILFPNAHAIYLHDTNEPELFAERDRALSYGCVRLADPIGFSDAIAGFDKHLESQMPGTLVGNGEEGDREIWLRYAAKMPIHLVYFTYEVAADGSVTTHEDVYGYDTQQNALAAGKAVSPVDEPESTQLDTSENRS